MFSDQELAEYTQELRGQVCSRCIEKLPGGPPCAPLGKRCGIELDLPQLIDSVHCIRSGVMNPNIETFRGDVCPLCANRGSALARWIACSCSRSNQLTKVAIRNNSQTMTRRTPGISKRLGSTPHQQYEAILPQ